MGVIWRLHIYRTEFLWNNGEPIQKIRNRCNIIVNYSEIDEQELEDYTKRLIKPFELDTPPLIRIHLFKLKQNKYALFFDRHHIISDGASLYLLLKEFIDLYENKYLPSPKYQYKDFIEWNNKKLLTDELDSQKQYWINLLQDNIPLLNLPIDKPRPAIKSTNGKRYEFKICENQSKTISEYSLNLGVTLFTFMLTNYYTLLVKHTGQTDIIIGIPHAGRNISELENLMGMFVNIMPLRIKIGTNLTFLDLLEKVKEVYLESLDYTDYPLDMTIENIKLSKDMRHPLFDTMFVLQNTPELNRKTNNFTIERRRLDQNKSQMDLSLEIIPSGNEIKCVFEYSTDIFSQNTIELMANRYRKIIENSIENGNFNINELDIIPFDEKEKLLNEFNNSFTEYPCTKTVHELFENQVEKTPNRVAIRFGKSKLTYRQLNAKSNQLAHYLRSRGVELEEAVSILYENSLELVIGILGIIKAGACYVPVDPHYPEERIKYMLSECKTRFVLCQEKFLDKVSSNYSVINLNTINLENYNSSNLKINIDPDKMLYILFTSGSTGMPKGVMIKHQGIVNYITWRNRAIKSRENDVTLQLISVAFDGFGINFYSSLLSGGCLVMVSQDKWRDFKYVVNLIKHENVTVMAIVPAIYKEILNESNEDDIKSLSRITLGGERLPSGLIKQSIKLNPKILIINEYGPTENSIISTAHFGVTPENTAIVGKPIQNNKVYIIDEHHKMVPIGITGEIVVESPGLAKGYINQKELTNKNFIENIYESKERVYKTGDLGRWLSNGTIEFLGRIDDQIKIRGHRIELGEVETILLSNDKISECIVVARKLDHSDKVLCAYIVTKKLITNDEIRNYMSQYLPRYMIPAYFIQLDKLPITPVGKVDKHSLPNPLNFKQKINTQYPVNETEEILIKIWKRVLKLNNIGVNDDFFELGGHSIHTVKFEIECEKINLPLTSIDLYKYNTIARLSKVIPSN